VRERIHAKRAWIRAVVVGWSQESNDLILLGEKRILRIFDSWVLCNIIRLNRQYTRC
jgi:hypothetical protein